MPTPGESDRGARAHRSRRGRRVLLHRRPLRVVRAASTSQNWSRDDGLVRVAARGDDLDRVCSAGAVTQTVIWSARRGSPGGGRCTSTRPRSTRCEAFYDEVSSAWELPSWFGRNLDALFDVLGDLTEHADSCSCGTACASSSEVDPMQAAAVLDVAARRVGSGGVVRGDRPRRPRSQRVRRVAVSASGPRMSRASGPSAVSAVSA